MPVLTKSTVVAGLAAVLVVALSACPPAPTSGAGTAGPEAVAPDAQPDGRGGSDGRSGDGFAPDGSAVSDAAPPPADGGDAGRGTPDAGAGDAPPGDAGDTETLPDPEGPTSVERIAEAEEAGLLDAETALLYKTYAVFGDPRLPAEFAGAPPLWAGDIVLGEVLEKFATLSAPTRALLMPFRIPPIYPRSWFGERVPGRGGAAPVPKAALWEELPPFCAADVMPGWGNIDRDRFRVWWYADGAPEHEVLATRVAQSLDNVIWSALTDGLMQRQPLPDDTARACPGADSRLDIYITEGIAALGMAVPLETGADVPTLTCHARPGFVVLNAAVGLHSTIEADSVVAHEFFHILQYAFAAGWGCFRHQETNWLREGTATWAEAEAVPALPARREVADAYLSLMYFGIYEPLRDEKFVYGTYLFPLFMQRRLGDRDFARRAYANLEGAPEFFAAVDQVLPGGFEAVWPEFVLCATNREPYPCFQADGVQDGLAFYPSRMEVSPTVPEALETVPQDKLLLPGLAGFRSAYRLPDDSVRAVHIVNSFAGLPHVRVTGILHFPDRPPVVRDWTALPEIRLCRDRTAERLDDLNLVVSNADFRARTEALFAHPAIAYEARFSNVACWRYAGTITSTHHLESYDPWLELSVEKDTTVKAAVRFEAYDPPVTVPPGDDQGQLFRLVAGTLAVQSTQVNTHPEETCTIQAVWNDIPIENGQFHLHLTGVRGQRGRYAAWNTQSHRGPATNSCSGETQLLTGIPWWSVDLADGFTISADGTTLSGAVEHPVGEEVDGVVTSGSNRYEWQLTAERE